MPMPTHHISDLYFHAEFVQALGAEAGNRSFIEMSASRNRPDTAAKLGKGFSDQSCATPSRSACSSPICSTPTSPRQSDWKSNNFARSFDSSLVPHQILGLLGDNLPVNSEEKIGLLFTDAAHTVLLDFDP